MASRYQKLAPRRQEDWLAIGSTVVASTAVRYSFVGQWLNTVESPSIERSSHTLSTQDTVSQASQLKLSSDSDKSRTCPKKFSSRTVLTISSSEGCWAGLNNWWWWELGSVILSVGSLLVITVILALNHDRSLSAWKFFHQS